MRCRDAMCSRRPESAETSPRSGEGVAVGGDRLVDLLVGRLVFVFAFELAIEPAREIAHRLDPAAVHEDLVSSTINLRAIEAAGGLAAFGAQRSRKEVVQP